MLHLRPFIKWLSPVFQSEHSILINKKQKKQKKEKQKTFKKKEVSELIKGDF